MVVAQLADIFPAATSVRNRHRQPSLTFIFSSIHPPLLGRPRAKDKNGERTLHRQPVRGIVAHRARPRPVARPRQLGHHGPPRQVVHLQVGEDASRSTSRWKLVKERQNIRMYTERSSSTSSGELITGNGLPIILAVGTLQGQLDDLMHGVMSPTLESMRIKASYVDDFDETAVLDTLVEPSLDDPFQTLVLKWMEVDIPLVKNRDYVYLEGTGHVQTPTGERLGYHVMHSGNPPPTEPSAWQHLGARLLAADWPQHDRHVGYGRDGPGR